MTPKLTIGIVRKARDEALQMLETLGIEDHMSVDIYKFDDQPEWMTRYHGNSQFEGGIHVSVNSDILDLIPTISKRNDKRFYTVLVNSMLHEYAHAILEYMRLELPQTYKIYSDAYDTEQEEEQFCEDFIEYVRYNTSDWVMRQVIQAYMSDLKFDK